MQNTSDWNPETSSRPAYQTVPVTLLAYGVLFLVFSGPLAGFMGFWQAFHYVSTRFGSGGCEGSCRVRVAWPNDLHPGYDERLMLFLDSSATGQYVNLLLPIDRKVQVIGYLDVVDERRVVRSHAPPWANWVDGFTRLVSLTGLGRVFSDLFGFGARSGLFLVTVRLREKTISKHLLLRARRMLLRGVIWTVLAAIPLGMTMAAVMSPRKTVPGCVERCHLPKIQ